ncbi:MAG: carboxypeptidase-like regulatory domain-containing protein [Bryobacterales bacterium]
MENVSPGLAWWERTSRAPRVLLSHGNHPAALRLVLAGLLLTAVALGQTGQGTLTGTVTDPTGAIIPGVSIAINNENTGFNYAAQTNEQGLYRVPYLNAGVYTVTFEASGFKRIVHPKIQIRSTETLQVNVALEVGDVVESVEVSANATLLETETSSTGHLMTGEQLVMLPTPQMKIESMLFYVAGVNNQRSAAHSAGGRTRAFQLTNDGVVGTTPGTGTLGTGRNMSTSQHTMEEVKVLTTVLPAEYGHSGGGVMSVSYKSGANALHGVLEERYVSKQMIHRNWEDASVPAGKFGFHLMSAGINGPIKRNKTFFLWGFQRHHEKASENNDRTVPSPEMLNGDFSFPQSARVDPIYDPDSLVRLDDGTYSRTQFQNNMIPQSRFDPVARNFLALNPFTAPNDRNMQTFHNTQGPQNNLSADTIYRSYRTSFDTKIDHRSPTTTRSSAAGPISSTARSAAAGRSKQQTRWWITSTCRSRSTRTNS